MIRKENIKLVDHETIIPLSRLSTEIFKTGQWSPRKPLYREKLSPCREACPVGNDIPGILSCVAKGDFDGALALILHENPLPVYVAAYAIIPARSTATGFNLIRRLRLEVWNASLRTTGKQLLKCGPTKRGTRLRWQ